MIGSAVNYLETATIPPLLFFFSLSLRASHSPTHSNPGSSPTWDPACNAASMGCSMQGTSSEKEWVAYTCAASTLKDR